MTEVIDGRDIHGGNRTTVSIDRRAMCSRVLQASVLAGFLSACILCSVCRGGALECEDTEYASVQKTTLLRSEGHLVQLFGAASSRKTNLFVDDYDGTVARAEARFLLPRLSLLVDSRIALPDPFLVAMWSYLKDIDWEDRLDYGIGVEWRPLSKIDYPESALLRWLWHIRYYAVSLRTIRLNDRPEWDWRPDGDIRVGMELYRECNIYNARGYWGELWLDASWRETDFYVDDYESWRFAVVPKLGLRLSPRASLSVMPYLTGELVATERSDFWQNRILGGFGIRLMPFRWHRRGAAMLTRGTRLYFEALWVLGYLKDEAPDEIPEHDLRFGVDFVVNWW